MSYLSWLFFCLSPFALFCSGSGTGLILCPVFIMLGFIFRYAGSGSSGTPTGVVKVEPQDFWEWHYKKRVGSSLVQKDLGDEGKMAIHDREAREWATTICGYHNVWVPPKSTQEQIARENGFVTEQMIKERNEKKDRLQIGKYFLMCELKQKYEEKCFYPKSPVHNVRVSPKRYKDIIEHNCKELKLKNSAISISEFGVSRVYKTTIKEMWDDLTEQEKQQATEWVKKYEERLLERVKQCEENGGYFYKIDMED